MRAYAFRKRPFPVPFENEERRQIKNRTQIKKQKQEVVNPELEPVGFKKQRVAGIHFGREEDGQS